MLIEGRSDPMVIAPEGQVSEHNRHFRQLLSITGFSAFDLSTDLIIL